MLMVWAAIKADGRSPLVFITEYYRENLLEHIKALGTQIFRPHTLDIPTVLSAIALSTRHPIMVKKWASSLNFHRTPKSADANPLDYCACSILESKVGTKKHQSVDHLNKEFSRQWDKIPRSHFRAACDDFIGRLKKSTDSKALLLPTFFALI